MIQQKLLKLAKRLNSFELDDIVIMSGEEEKQIILILEALIKEGHIKLSTNGSYLYLEKIIKSQSKKSEKVINIEIKPREMFKPEDLFDPEKEKRDYEKYLKAPEFARKKADKYLRVLELSRGLSGSKLKDFADKWNIVYPDMRTSYSQILRARHIVRLQGKAALLAAYGKNYKSPSTIDEELYGKFVRKYLSPLSPRFSDTYKKLKAEYELENPEFNNFPSSRAIDRRIKKDFTAEEIFNFRNSEIKPYKTMPAKKVIKESKPIFTGDFKKAAELFLEDNYLKRLKPSTSISYKGYIKNHLIPFFEDFKLPDITEKVINEFKLKKLDEDFSISSINSYLDTLRIIIKTYYPECLLSDSIKLIDEKNYYKDIRILNEAEIKRLLNTANDLYPDFYSLLYTAISTGITRSEILALTVDCIDFENKIIKVEKSLYKGEIIRHRNKYQVRDVNISDELCKILKNEIKTNQGIVFANLDGKVQDPDNMIKRRFNPVVKKSGIKPVRFIDLRDTFAALLIKQNMPLTYIQQQLGHSSVNVTAERYKNLIPDVKIGVMNLI